MPIVVDTVTLDKLLQCDVLYVRGNYYQKYVVLSHYGVSLVNWVKVLSTDLYLMKK